MLLDDLVGCIELLQARIRSHGDALRENETRTRMALIDPLLRALGWDVFDPEVVTPEYKVGTGWVDYALRRADGRPAATMEAKKLGEALNTHRMQMLNYANASGIEYAGLTDGNHWELYSVFERGQLDDRRKLEVSIADTPAHTCALELLLLWRPNLASGEPVRAAAPILGERRQESTPPEVEPVPPVSSDWVTLSEYAPPGNTPCPAAIRFWDGSEQTLKRWYEILTGVVRKLHSEGRLGVKDVPIGRGRKRCMVHTDAVHPSGEAFVNAKKVEETPFVVDVNMSARTVRENTKQLLQLCNRDPAEVHLRAAR